MFQCVRFLLLAFLSVLLIGTSDANAQVVIIDFDKLDDTQMGLGGGRAASTLFGDVTEAGRQQPQ